MTREDDDYPTRLRDRLRDGAPPVLYGSGGRGILDAPGLAIVGSRDADALAISFCEQLGRHCAENGTAVYSGAAKGVDTAAMMSAAERNGAVVGVLPDGLEGAIRKRDFRPLLVDSNLTLISPYHPAARFSVGAAMGRNRIIYALSCAAVVVSSGDAGGTWNGAIENVHAGWVPLFVRSDGSEPPGNRALVVRGGRPVALDQLLAQAPLDVLLPGTQSGSTDSGPHCDRLTGELFEVVWPHIADYLNEPQTEKRIASDLGLTQSQTRAWLRRAVDAGLIEVVGKPRRYRRPAPQPETLFDG